LSTFLVPISELQHAFLPSKCYKPRRVFIFGLVIESIKELGGASNPLPKFVVDLTNTPFLTTFVLGATTISSLVVVMTTLGD